MKRHLSGKRSMLSLLLTICLLWELLPMPMTALAVGGAPVTVVWEPQEQTVDGAGSAELSVSLDEKAGGPAAAMVEITLESEEADALQYSVSEVIPESALGTNSGEEAGTGGGEEAGTGSGEEVGTGGEEEAGTGGGEETGTGGGDEAGQGRASQVQSPSQTALLIQKNEGGMVLRVLLIGTGSYQRTLDFSAANGDITVDVASGDIRVRTYQAGEEIPDISRVPLLRAEESSGDGTIVTGPFTILQTRPEEITVDADQKEPVALDGGGNTNISYTVSILKPAAGEGDRSYDFTITWPQALTRPEGALTLSEPAGEGGAYTVMCGESALAAVSVPDSLGIVIAGLTADDSGLTFTLTVPALDESGDGEDEENPAGGQFYEVAVSVNVDSFTRIEEELQDQVTLSTSNREGETISDSVTVTAGAASRPG